MKAIIFINKGISASLCNSQKLSQWSQTWSQWCQCSRIIVCSNRMNAMQTQVIWFKIGQKCANTAAILQFNKYIDYVSSVQSFKWCKNKPCGPLSALVWQLGSGCDIQSFWIGRLTACPEGTSPLGLPVRAKDIIQCIQQQQWSD